MVDMKHWVAYSSKLLKLDSNGFVHSQTLEVMGEYA